MPAIIFLLPLIPLLLASRRSPGWLFVCIYLPILLLIPDTFHTVTGGIPKISANQAIILVILPLALFRHFSTMRFHLTDFLILTLMVVMAVSEYQAMGYKEAQNLTFNFMAAAVAPYFVARLVIPAENLHVATARMFVILLFGFVLVSIFEFRFGWNPFIGIIGKLFPGQGNWNTTFRYGFARIAGPFSNALLAGIVIVIAYRLHRWLEWNGHWDKDGTFFGWRKSRVISVVLILGSIMTIARGPQLGGIIGAIAVFAGRAKNRNRVIIILAVLAFVIGPIAYSAFMSYLDIRPGAAMTMSQESAIYRKVLIERYMDIALDHAWLGWGRNTWPKVPGMASIDNYFLLLALMHGVLACFLLVFIFLWQMVRLFLHGMRTPPENNSIAFTFCGILIAVFISIVTVYLGEQVMPALFLIFGWAESVLSADSTGPASEKKNEAPVSTRPFRILR
jgi:hypothetical protein